MLDIDLFTHIAKYLDNKSICNISLTNRCINAKISDEVCYRKGKYIIEHCPTIFMDKYKVYHQIVNIDLIYIKQLWKHKYMNHRSYLYFDILNSCARYGKIDCIEWMYKNKIGCENLYKTIKYACIGDSLNVIKWFYKNKIIEFDEKTSQMIMKEAIFMKHPKVYKWIHKNINMKYTKDYLDILVEYMMDNTIDTRNINYIKWLFENIIKNNENKKYHINMALCKFYSEFKHFQINENNINSNNTKKYIEIFNYISSKYLE